MIGVTSCHQARPEVGLISMAKSKPIPGSTGEVLTCLPSPYIPHAATGLLYLPRMIAKCRYVQEHGEMPKSYRKNYGRGLDRFIAMHLGVEPKEIETAVHTSVNDAELDAKLLALFPDDVRAIKWNRELVQKGMTKAGREFLAEALTNMGCADRTDEIISVPDLMDFDEGRIQ